MVAATLIDLSKLIKYFLRCYMDLSKLLLGFVKVEEMLHAMQRSFVTGGGCDCDKAIFIQFGLI